MSAALSLRERLVARTIPNDAGCVVWTGFVDRDGYGRLGVDGVYSGAHRVAYELAKGAIPPGLQIDHLCRNRACCNPDHLEAVSPRENTMRSTSFAAVNARKTTCAHGHPLEGDNVRRSARQRFCRTCERVNAARYRAKKAGGAA